MTMPHENTERKLTGRAGNIVGDTGCSAPEPELQQQLNEALFLGKFMGAISATLDPEDVCSIGARILYDYAPYRRIVFALASDLGGRNIIFSPTKDKRREIAGEETLQRVTQEEDSPDPGPAIVVLPNTGRRFRGYSADLQEGLGKIEIIFDREAASHLTDEFLDLVVESFSRTLKNALEYSKVKDLAMRDGLTGLFNRRVFDEMLKIEGQRPELMPLSLLLIDVDNFKQINDTHGHPAGDQVLATFGRILREGCRGTDLVARYGGEEFAVMLPGTTSSIAFEIAQRLRTRLAATTFVFGTTPLRLTVSIGLASTSDSAKPSVSDLVHRADHALYRAKKNGKNRVHISSPRTTTIEVVPGKTCQPTNARLKPATKRQVEKQAICTLQF